MRNFFLFSETLVLMIVHMLTPSILVLYFLSLSKNDCAFSSWHEMFHFPLPGTTLPKKLLEKLKIELTVQCGRKNTPINDLWPIINLFRCEFYTSINSKKQKQKKIHNETKQDAHRYTIRRVPISEKYGCKQFPIPKDLQRWKSNSADNYHTAFT